MHNITLKLSKQTSRIFCGGGRQVRKYVPDQSEYKVRTGRQALMTAFPNLCRPPNNFPVLQIISETLTEEMEVINITVLR